ncbi:hypothetical protein C7M84_008961 [Penaeus vannamei]|uniref:Uncharacterized protein n=1 Tax=Penaeus vannamei TaxID=6689 RepID=A0A3R7PP19_PENVA|nr:hypothetical protein C7M84_008961 [Penaeus vannamei]
MRPFRNEAPVNAARAVASSDAGGPPIFLLRPTKRPRVTHERLIQSTLDSDTSGRRHDLRAAAGTQAGARQRFLKHSPPRAPAGNPGAPLPKPCEVAPGSSGVPTCLSIHYSATVPLGMQCLSCHRATDPAKASGRCWPRSHVLLRVSFDLSLPSFSSPLYFPFIPSLLSPLLSPFFLPSPLSPFLSPFFPLSSPLLSTFPFLSPFFLPPLLPSFSSLSSLPLSPLSFPLLLSPFFLLSSPLSLFPPSFSSPPQFPPSLFLLSLSFSSSRSHSPCPTLFSSTCSPSSLSPPAPPPPSFSSSFLLFLYPLLLLLASFLCTFFSPDNVCKALDLLLPTSPASFPSCPCSSLPSPSSPFLSSLPLYPFLPPILSSPLHPLPSFLPLLSYPLSPPSPLVSRACASCKCGSNQCAYPPSCMSICVPNFLYQHASRRSF